jgi:hypothetical protein
VSNKFDRIEIEDYRLLEIEFSAFGLIMLPLVSDNMREHPLTLDKIADQLEGCNMTFHSADLAIDCEYDDGEVEIDEIFLKIDKSLFPIKDHISEQELNIIKVDLIAVLTGVD